MADSKIAVAPKGRPPRWTASEVVDGIQTVHTKKFQLFVEYINQEIGSDFEDYIYRGHRKESYRLVSTLDRKAGKDLNYSQVKKDLLEQFKLASRGKRGPSPVQYEDDRNWWSLGQHFGLLTPLLDWSLSPYAAAYFAFEKTKDDDERNRVVYFLKRTVVIDSLGFLNLFLPNTDENARVISQNGLFTYSDDPVDIEEYVKKKHVGQNQRVLVKFVIPNTERKNALVTLDSMNINHMTLFPDLMGASLYSNIKIFG